MALNLLEQDKERRSFKRKNIHASIRYELKSSLEYGSVLTRDMSESGIRINFEKFIPYNTDMILQMKLPALPKVINTIGKVVWSQRIPHSDRYQLGLKFEGVTEEQRLELSGFLRGCPDNKTCLI